MLIYPNFVRPVCTGRNPGHLSWLKTKLVLGSHQAVDEPFLTLFSQTLPMLPVFLTSFQQRGAILWHASQGLWRWKGKFSIVTALFLNTMLIHLTSPFAFLHNVRKTDSIFTASKKLYDKCSPLPWENYLFQLFIWYSGFSRDNSVVAVS